MSNNESLDEHSYVSDDDPEHRSSLQKDFEYYEQV